MKSGIQPGLFAELSIIVEDGMRPFFDGKVVHDVLSTVSMIYFMEKVGRKLILPYLEDDEEGAGFAIEVKHLSPAVIGQKVDFRAICTEVNQKRVVCSVTAETGDQLIGKGSFTQAIFKKRDLEQRLSDLRLKVDMKRTNRE